MSLPRTRTGRSRRSTKRLRGPVNIRRVILARAKHWFPIAETHISFSRNPHCTAVFYSVPRNQIFLRRPAGTQIPSKKPVIPLIPPNSTSRLQTQLPPRKSTFPSHHVSRSEHLSWGNQLVAGLGARYLQRPTRPTRLALIRWGTRSTKRKQSTKKHIAESQRRPFITHIPAPTTISVPFGRSKFFTPYRGICWRE